MQTGCKTDLDGLSLPSALSPAPGKVDFLVVGTPRSGTTLVQRLACEVPGVVTPPETHFFPGVMGELVQPSAFPLAGAELRRVLDAYVALGPNAGLGLDVSAVMQALGGRCQSPVQLFNAVVVQLTGGGEVIGEKTPSHIRWWRPLSQADPTLRFIVVSRDPRAVVSSNLGAPWSEESWAREWGEDKYLFFAFRWQYEDLLARRLARQLGPRVLALRYEDVVAAPDRARWRIARFLGRPANSAAPGRAPESIVMPWESWKHRALGPIGDRSSRWREAGHLTSAMAEDVAAVCWLGMARHHYRLDPPWVTARALARLSRRARTLRRLRGIEIDWQRRIEGAGL